MKDQVRGGSNTLFLALKIINMIVLLCGVLITGMGIWVWVAFSVFDPTQIIVILLGLIQCLSVFVAWSARNSIRRLLIYNIILYVLFTAQLIAIIVGFALESTIIKNVMDKTGRYDKHDEFKKMYSIVYFHLCGNELILIILLVVTYYYVRSVRDTDFESDYIKIQEDGIRILVQEKYDPQSGALKYKQNQTDRTDV